MNYFIGIIAVILMLNFSGCIGRTEIPQEEVFWESALNKTLETSLIIKKDDKSLVNVISTMVVAAVPMVLDSVLDIIRFVVYSATIVTLFTNPLATMLSAVSIVLTYFGVKELLGVEEEKESIKKFAVAKVIVAVLMFVLTRIGLA